MRFEKWQALGNDYLIIERSNLRFELTPARVRRLCQRHFGIFADGILLLSPAGDPRHVAELEIFNPDGSQSELSGNGARQAILYLRRHRFTDADEFSILTPSGPICATITGPLSCRVDMGRARLRSGDYPSGRPDGLGELTTGSRTWRFRHVSIGNPQCAIAVAHAAALAALDLESIGPGLEAHPDFPNRTNVSFYCELDDGRPARIRARIFERGVGETLSSGTGASGAAIAYLLGRGADHGDVIVALDGGELEVALAGDLRVHLSGWALPVFAGELSDELLDELHKLD